MESFGIPQVMYASLAPNHVLITVAFTVATALLAAIIPARTATHLEPIEAIRFTA
jgi:ABC-type antimicrobial peptide transport system permease subunit